MKRLISARTGLLLDQPFFGVLALQLDVYISRARQTAWTDGKSIGWNPDFVNSLSHDEVIAVFAHEVMHCAAGHCWRRDARQPKKWNIAADYAINQLLRDAKFKLPATALLDPQYDGKWAEWIYDRLPDGCEDGSGASGSGTGKDDPSGMGEVLDAPDGDSSAPTEADWQQITQQSLQQAKARGQLPSTLERLINAQVKPVVDWRSALRRFIQDFAKADYAWQQPSRRYMAAGLYLPSLRSHEMGRIAVAVDTSGSIDDVLLAQFNAELQSIADECKPSVVDVLYCDAHVHRRESFQRDEPIILTPCGGGGTDFRPVFDAIDQSDEQPIALVYLTDTYGTFPSSAPEYPVIWAVCGSTQSPTVPPFGELIE